MTLYCNITSPKYVFTSFWFSLSVQACLAYIDLWKVISVACIKKAMIIKQQDKNIVED